MKKGIVVLVMVLLISLPCWADGLTVWGLTEQDISSNQNAISARVGYQFGSIEAFMGSTWRPDYDVETEEISPPQIISAGAVYHLDDILDANSPIPWIPELLLTFIPEEWLATPYAGAQASFNFFDRDAGFYGGVVGILMKTQPDSTSAFVAEAVFNENFYDLNAVPDEFRLNLGFRFYFE